MPGKKKFLFFNSMISLLNHFYKWIPSDILFEMLKFFCSLSFRNSDDIKNSQPYLKKKSS